MVICLLSFNRFHLGKDSGKDKFSKGREEEKSPVETKDVDHLDENLQNKLADRLADRMSPSSHL